MSALGRHMLPWPSGSAPAIYQRRCGRAARQRRPRAAFFLALPAVPFVVADVLFLLAWPAFFLRSTSLFGGAGLWGSAFFCREPLLAGFRLERVVFADTAFGAAGTASSTFFWPLPSASETRPRTTPAAADAAAPRA